MLDYWHRRIVMAKRAESKIHRNINENDIRYFECKNEYESILAGQFVENNTNILKHDDMADFDIIVGKVITSDEISDLTALINILSEFFDVCAAAIVKKSIPCGVALAPTTEEAYTKALDCNPIALSNSAVGFTQKIDYPLAKIITSTNIKLILATGIDSKALNLLQEKNNIKVVILKSLLKDTKQISKKNIKITPFGIIHHDVCNINLNQNSFNITTKTRPTTEQIEDLVFAWKISKYTKSNSAIVVKDFKTISFAQGFASNSDAVEYAVNKACDGAKDAILVTDTEISTPDCIYLAAQGRISAIIQPGGGIEDKKIIELADKYNISVITTGIKNYTM